MTLQDRDRLKEIFWKAHQLAGPERATYLATACAGDAALRQQVEDLLYSLADAGEFLGEPTISHSNAGDTQPALGEAPGTLIGPYKLLQIIGEGGFGSVYMAEQQEPVIRRVALKIIKLGMDTRQVIARFEAERQALAIMDHPNIARVLDAGATATGRPYFVMELVRGEPITAYCDNNHLSTHERLALFIDICHAVQHAHTKGIIHRDLKPTNILVTVQDARPVPKVIDFGIAKALHQRLTEKTLFTEHRQLIGTPEYMSPEQANPSAVDIDTRCDVYSLGVLLYELLTGVTPLDAERLRSAAFAEMQRIIREEEPPKPSTRLTTLEDLPSVAVRRHAEPRTLGALVRGDLDWIVMKCLEKDRTRRYETANELATDIRKHLSGEPVAAVPPSAAYRLRKFVRRNRAIVATAVVIIVTLSVATWVSLAFAFREAAAREEEERQRAYGRGREELWKIGLTSAAPDGAGGVFLFGNDAEGLGGPHPGAWNAFVMRYDSAGQRLWMRRFGKTTDDLAIAAATDGAGGVYLIGPTHASHGGPHIPDDRDVSLARYDGAGHRVWSREFGTPEFDEPWGAAPDAAGGVYVVGRTRGDLAGPTFGSFDAFVVRYDSKGERVWARQLGTPEYDEAATAAPDGSGGVYVGGSTHGIFDQPGVRDDYQAFVARYSVDGDQLWVREFGTPLYDDVTGSAADGSGGVYVVGTTGGALAGPSAGGSDAFVMRYDKAGNLLWARQFGTPYDDAGQRASSDGSGCVYITGTIRDSDSDADGERAFVARYDGQGNQLWVHQFRRGAEDGLSGAGVVEPRTGVEAPMHALGTDGN